MPVVPNLEGLLPTPLLPSEELEKECNTSGVMSSLSTKIMAHERDLINIASSVDGHAILNFGE